METNSVFLSHNNHSFLHGMEEITGCEWLYWYEYGAVEFWWRGEVCEFCVCEGEDEGED